MQNPFAFDWMVDLFSLGTTYLYRTYRLGAHLTSLAIEAEQWRLPPMSGPTWQDAGGIPLQSTDVPLETPFEQDHTEFPKATSFPPGMSANENFHNRDARDAPLIHRVRRY